MVVIFLNKASFKYMSIAYSYLNPFFNILILKPFSIGLTFRFPSLYLASVYLGMKYSETSGIMKANGHVTVLSDQDFTIKP